MREAPLTDRRRIAKVFVIGTMGLAVMLGMTTDATTEEFKIVFCKCYIVAPNRPPEEVYIRGKSGPGTGCFKMIGSEWLRKDGTTGHLQGCVQATPPVKPPITPGPGLKQP